MFHAFILQYHYISALPMRLDFRAQISLKDKSTNIYIIIALNYKFFSLIRQIFNYNP